MLVFVQTLCGSAQILLFLTVLNLIKKKRRTHTSDWTFHWHGLKRGKTQGSAQHRVLTPLHVFYTTANAVGSNCPGNLGGPEFSRDGDSSCLSHLEKKKHRLWIKKKKLQLMSPMKHEVFDAGSLTLGWDSGRHGYDQQEREADCSAHGESWTMNERSRLILRFLCVSTASPPGCL